MGVGSGNVGSRRKTKFLLGERERGKVATAISLANKGEGGGKNLLG